MCLVSVIIPTYNHCDLILETLDSVFAQTFSDYEIIVINDGSPDDTGNVLQHLIRDGRIRYYEQENAGQAAARNAGINYARGEYIALLDDDDLWPPDKLEWQVDALGRASDMILVYGYYQSFGQAVGAGRFPHNPTGDVRRSARRAGFIGSPGQTLIRRNSLRDVGGFDGTLWGIDDWDLYIRLARAGPFLYEDRNALFYRVHAANASKNVSMMFQNALRLREKHLGQRKYWADWIDWWNMGRWIRRHYARELQRNAMIFTADGRRTEAVNEICAIVCVDPTFFLGLANVRWLAGFLIRGRRS